MAKGATTDYFDLAGISLQLMGGDPGTTQQTMSHPNENGDTEIEDYYAERDAPSNNYSVITDFDAAAAIKLGALTDNGAQPGTILTEFNINTEAGVAPTVDVSGEGVKTGSTQGRTATLPAQTLLCRHKAQTLFGAFTFSGEGVHLIKCSAAGKINLTRSPDAEGICVDVHGARIDVQATFKKNADNAIALTGGSGWLISTPLKLVESDKDYEEYTVTLSLNIAADDPVAP